MEKSSSFFSTRNYIEISWYKMLVLLSSQENSCNYYNLNYSAEFSTTEIVTA